MSHPLIAAGVTVAAVVLVVLAFSDDSPRVGKYLIAFTDEGEGQRGATRRLPTILAALMFALLAWIVFRAPPNDPASSGASHYDPRP